MSQVERDRTGGRETEARGRPVDDTASPEKTRPEGDGREPRPAAPEAWGRGDSNPRGADPSNERDRRGHAHDDKDAGKPADEGKEKKPWSTTRKVVVAAIVAAVLLVGTAAGVAWWLYARQFEKTDDAFVDAHVERVAPQVAGRVRRVPVGDNQPVRAGDVLLEIDPADYQVSLDQAKAAVAEAQGGVSQAQAQQRVAEANVAQAQADVDQARVTEQNAGTQLARYEGLSKEAVIPQRLDDLRAAARNAAAQRVAAEKKLAAARAEVQLAASKVDAARAQVQAAQARVDQAQLNLGYSTVRATTAGRVTTRDVRAGDYVTPGQQVMVIVPDDVWVTANYKETQLDRMRVGQEAEIDVDAYPDVTLRGRVDSIQKGSGAWFSLLPPENATGNYVKVVQRVPVKIVFQDKDADAYRRLAPGMSVVPKVRVR